MGRGCTMNEWAHFEKRPQDGRVPNSSYWYVVCRHCVRGYEEKHLPAYPGTLTGRRSAMRAHLKVCPMYGAQYRPDQHHVSNPLDDMSADNLAHDSNNAGDTELTDLKQSLDTETGITDSFLQSSATQSQISDVKDEHILEQSELGMKKHRSRQRLSSGGTHSRGRSKHCMMEEWNHFVRLQDEGYIGKSNFFHAICKHCNNAYMAAPEDKKAEMIPEKMVGRREKMRKHLSVCPYFKGDLPPMERRVHLRHGLVPNIFAARSIAQSKNMQNNSGIMSAMSSSVSGSSISMLTAANGAQNSHFPIMNSGGNSRLALDEWNYFTRLERKKESAYYYARCNFCQAAYDNASENMKSSMEPTIVMGRKSNMQTHLSKCPHVPTDPSILGGSVSSGMMDTHADMVTYLGASNYKRQKLLGDSTSASLIGTNEAVIMQWYRTIFRFTFHHGLPFEWVEQSSALDLLTYLFPRDANVPYGVSVPLAASELRTTILEAAVRDKELSESLKLHADMESNAALIKSADDQYPRMLMMEIYCTHIKNSALPRMEVLLRRGTSHLNLSAFRRHMQQKNDKESPREEDSIKIAAFHGMEIARVIELVIQEIETGDGNYRIGIVLLPCGEVFLRASNILRSRWPQVLFTFDIHDLLYFPLIQFLSQPEVESVVRILKTNDCLDGKIAQEYSWKRLHILLQAKLDETASLLEDQKLSTMQKHMPDRELWIRVASFIQAFTHIMDVLSGSRGKFGDVVTHIGTLYHAADTFPDVQASIEDVWRILPQPFYVLSNALHPHLRLQGLVSSDLTKPSTLSDFGVAYFQRIFGYKSNSLRGDVTAYMHSSKEVFSTAFISEFPLVDDFFRYLSDNYTDLALLMEFLCSNGSLMVQKRDSSQKILRHALQTDMYTMEEAKKLEILTSYWQLEELNHVTWNSSPDRTSCTPEQVVKIWISELYEMLTFNGSTSNFLDLARESAMEDAASSAALNMHKEDSDQQVMDQERCPIEKRDTDDKSLDIHIALSELWQNQKISLAEIFYTREATI